MIIPLNYFLYGDSFAYNILILFIFVSRNEVSQFLSTFWYKKSYIIYLICEIWNLKDVESNIIIIMLNNKAGGLI